MTGLLGVIRSTSEMVALVTRNILIEGLLGVIQTPGHILLNTSLSPGIFPLFKCSFAHMLPVGRVSE